MKEYIERKAVLDIVTEWCPDDDGSVGKTGDLRDMLDELEAIPAADVVEVRHGRWIEDGDCQYCSECGEEHSWADYRAAYCDECGAKMDGAAGNE